MGSVVNAVLTVGDKVMISFLRHGGCISLLFAILFAPHLPAQDIQSDTLVMKSGALKIGRVLNYPPEFDIVVLQSPDGTYHQIELKYISAIHVPASRKASVSLYTPIPVLSSFSSLIIPGLGQMINGQILKGIGFTALFLLGGMASTAAIVAADDKYAGVGATNTAIAVSVLTLGFYIYQIIDAGVVAGGLSSRAEKICPSEPLRVTRSNQSSYIHDGISLTIGVPF